jgi:hypothetical protein
MATSIVVTAEYLLARITAEHNQRPRYMATVALSVEPFIDGQNVALSYETLFDLDVAVGVQLDALGQWVGVTRYIAEPIEIFFTLDNAALGLDFGKWRTPYEVALQIVRLDDDHYRILLRARIVSNSWDGTIPQAYEAWNTLFAGTGYQVLIQDGMQRAERDFILDGDVFHGFDASLWRIQAALADIYFSLDSPEVSLGLDQGAWYGLDWAVTVPVAVAHGDMHIIEALLGPPLDAVVQALFSGGYLGLRAAGVGVDYVTQGQGPGAANGVGLPLFALDVPPDVQYWVSFDIVGLGHDQAPLYYPGAYPIEPGLPIFALDLVPPAEGTVYFSLDDNDPASLLDSGIWSSFPADGFDAGWWATKEHPVTEPDYYLILDDTTALTAPGPAPLTLDDTALDHGLDVGQWYVNPGYPHGLDTARWYEGAWYPPAYDPDQVLPPTGVEYPPTALAGLDLGGWAWQVAAN